MTKKHDWEKISKEYIEAPSDDARPFLEDLARKHGVSFGYIQQKCAKDKWVEQSKMFLRRVSEESQAQKVTSLAGEQTTFDSSILTVARGLQNQIVAHLNESVRRQKQLKEAISSGKEITSEMMTDVLIPPKDISLLSGSLATVQRIGRTALDLDSWTPDKVVNEALKLGFIVTDPRTNTSDASENGESASVTESSNPFDSLLSEPTS